MSMFSANSRDRRLALRTVPLAILLLVLPMTGRPAGGATLLQFNLSDLVERADRIFAGTVEEIVAGTVTAGGAEIPTRTYRIRVEESFRGAGGLDPGGQVVEIRMVWGGKPKLAGEVLMLPVLPKMPDLKVGERYLLFTTPPSAVGLSTTVGLGQGCFLLAGSPGEESALNEFGNVGLFVGMEGEDLPGAGPIPFRQLGDLVRDQLAAE